MRFVSMLLAFALFACFPLAARTPSGRVVTSLDAGWRVHKGEVPEGERADLSDSDWLPATLPHTVNAGDGETGGGYYRGPSWYRRQLEVSDLPSDRRAFLQFDGAAVRADIFVNGNKLIRHDGGFAAFRVDITDAIHRGTNLIAVRTDNSKSLAIAPMGGDFTIFGGLYRSVSFVETANVHVDMLDHGGPGLYGHVTSLSDKQAIVAALVRLRNDGHHDAQAIVTVRIRDALGREVAAVSRPISLAANDSAEVSLPLRVAAPHRWDGRRSPYLYRLEAEVKADDAADKVSVPLGLRTIGFDPQRGFLLNGKAYPLHGVDYFHPERPGSGTAVTDAQVDQDMKMLDELGATGLRLVHFQHPQRVYDDADRIGLPVWTEIPLNGVIDRTGEFRANVDEQMRELIRQNYNHPSVILWGIGNEVYATDPAVAETLGSAAATARAEDPSRPTVYAHCCQADDDPKAMVSDVIGFNRYFGWYPDQKGSIGAWAERYHSLYPERPFAVSEYGAGASVRQQQVPPPAVNQPGSGWHPEQAQTTYHRASWAELRDKSYLFGTFVWVAFDVASDGRHEGDRAGINDKGLVTYDRAIRKDAYYWYQANWPEKPVLHLLDKRLKDRPSDRIAIDAVSNAATVSLTVNGKRVARSPVIDHVAHFADVRLRLGANRVRATAVRKGRRITDDATWVRTAPSSFGIQSRP